MLSLAFRGSAVVDSVVLFAYNRSTTAESVKSVKQQLVAVFALSAAAIGCAGPGNFGPTCIPFAGLCIVLADSTASRATCDQVDHQCQRGGDVTPDLSCTAAPHISTQPLIRLFGTVHPFETITGAGAIEVAAIDQQSSSLLGRVEITLHPETHEATYSLTNLPTEKRFLLRTASSGPWQSWATAYRAVIPTTSGRVCDNENADECFDAESSAYRVNLFGVSKKDYVDVPAQAGLIGSITGASTVIGEIRDCMNIRVQGAAVAMSPSPSRLEYYSGFSLPIPDSSRFTIGTGPLGMFGAFDQSTASTTVQVAGVLGPSAALSNLGRETFTPVADAFNFIVIHP